MSKYNIKIKFIALDWQTRATHGQYVRSYPTMVVGRPAYIPKSTERDGEYEAYDPATKQWHTFYCVDKVWVKPTSYSKHNYWEGHGTDNYYLAVNHPGEAILNAILTLPARLRSKEATNLERYWRMKRDGRRTYVRARLDAMRILGKDRFKKKKQDRNQSRLRNV